MAKQGFARRIAQWFGFSKKPQQRVSTRQYQAARGSRLATGFNPSSTSADSQLRDSLRSLRDRSRQLVRDAAYAKRAKEIVINNVVGSGIGMQSQVKTTRGDLNTRVNDSIEIAFNDYWMCADSCHTGGRLAGPDMERTGLGEVFEAGEVVFREHYGTFGNSTIPYALELVESERIADDFVFPSFGPNGNEVRMGVEVDRFQRPVAYYIRTRHPNDLRFTMAQPEFDLERVPAENIIHLAIVDRWPQTRGEPWMHATALTQYNIDGYVDAEVTRARIQACNVGAIETPEDATSFGEEQDDGTVEMQMEPGIYKRLNPGEKLNAEAPNSPNPQFEPFMRTMIRQMAAGTRGVSYESLSKDYSQSNYSSSRLALLDDRDAWRAIQGWFIRTLRHRVHKSWLKVAVYSGAIAEIPQMEYALNPSKFEAVRFKPRGWSWIDPSSEVESFERAIKDGMTTLSTVVAATADGRDLEDIIEERKQELEMIRKAGLEFETNPEIYNAAAIKDKAAAEASLRPEPKPPDAKGDKDSTDEPADRRVLSLAR